MLVHSFRVDGWAQDHFSRREVCDAAVLGRSGDVGAYLDRAVSPARGPSGVELEEVELVENGPVELGQGLGV